MRSTRSELVFIFLLPFLQLRSASNLCVTVSMSVGVSVCGQDLGRSCLTVDASVCAIIIIAIITTAAASSQLWWHAT